MTVVPLLRGQYSMLVTHDRTEVVCHSGGWGCGKTEGLAWGALREAKRYKNNYIAVAAATYPQLRRSTIRKFLALFSREGEPYKWFKQEKRVLFTNGSEIEFLSTEVPPEQQQGPEFGALFIDEGEGVDEDSFKALVSRVRKKDASRIIRLACNPPHRSHWIYRLFRKEPMPNWALIQSTTYENGHLPGTYIARLEHIYGYRAGKEPHEQPLAWRRYMWGEMGLPAEGAVYPELSDHIHVISEADWLAMEASPGKVVGHVCGMDFGANHPTAFLQLALTSDDVLVAVDEHRASFMPIDEHLEHISTFYKDGAPIFADHAAQDRLEYELKGLPTALAPKWVGVEQGIEAVRRRLVTGTLLIVRERCPLLYDEFQSYIWAKPKNPNVEYRDKPVKLNDDLLDCGRYAITGLDQAEQNEDADTLAEVFAERM